MRSSLQKAVAGLLFALTACQQASTPAGPAASARVDTAEVIPGQYIVVFRDAVADPAGLARLLVSAHGGSLRHSYATALKGFAARLPDTALTALRAHPLVAYVEPDRVVRVAGTEQMDLNGDPWGLDRIDQRALPLSRTYTYTSTGAGVHAYIIDTGIWTLHTEFGGRADNVYDVVGLMGQDCNGHGTHVAGTVGATTYGVAKRVFLHGVRVVFDCSGVGYTSDVIAGVDWVAAHHASPAVANMSLGAGDPDSALTAAVRTLWHSGVFVAVAAGNHAADACQLLPVAASGAFIVAASTNADAAASFSNWGPCVTGYAPGEAIKSAWLLNGTMTMSGTSMATPHVTGVAALYKATFGDAPSETVSNWILTNATPGAITGNPIGTANLLLFKGAL
jgi:subtilisin family serine protease